MDDEVTECLKLQGNEMKDANEYALDKWLEEQLDAKTAQESKEDDMWNTIWRECATEAGSNDWTFNYELLLEELPEMVQRIAAIQQQAKPFSDNDGLYKSLGMDMILIMDKAVKNLAERLVSYRSE